MTASSTLRQDLRNAAHWAMGAYKEFDINVTWLNHSASGILMWYPEDGHLIISIAGTDERSDIFHDVNTFPRKMSEWGEKAGICISEDAVDVVSTEGFLDYAASCYFGVTERLAADGIDLSEVASITIVGHSLGGAAAYLLQLTKLFESSRVYVFGCPRTFKRSKTKVPDRVRFSCWRIVDPVPYLPLSCHHPSAQVIIVPAYSGAVPRTRIAPGSIPIVVIYVAFMWIYGVYVALCNLCGSSANVAAFRAHRMSEYANNLEI